MPSVDIAMPIALLLVVTVALLLNERVEKKLKATVEEKEFQTRDIILLVVLMSIVISVIAYTSMLNPGAVFQNILLTIFLASYAMLLFTFSYVFSNMTKKRAQLLSVGFGVAGLIAGVASLIGPLADSLSLYRAAAFFGFAIFAFCALIIEHRKTSASTGRWYVALQPPAIFVLLFVFFNLFYSGGVQVWYPILLDVFGLTFAVLIILYLGSMFTWKTVGLFAVLLTILDIILVIGTGTMVAAAQQFTGLGLPVLVYLPNFPLMSAIPGYINFFGFAPRGLGLGDFFFAGILAVQTFKKFGKKTAFISIIAMTVAFAIWEAFLPEILNALESVIGRDIGGFPGTLMIISGWAPIIAWKLLSTRGKNVVEQPVAQQPSNELTK